MAEKLDEATFDAYIEQSELPVLIDFYTDGCIPCRRIAPLISKAEAEYAGKLNFARVNIGMNPGLIEKFAVEAAPTLVIIKGGEEVSRHRGAADAVTFKEFIENIF